MERRYSDEETARIIRLAAESEGSGERSRALIGAGRSLREIEQIAADVGIPAERVRQAAASIDNPERRVGWLGGTTKRYAERVLERELSPDQVSELVAAARRRFGTAGRVTEVLGSVEWTTDARWIHLSAVPGEGRTVIRLSGDYGGQVVATYGPSLLAGRIGVLPAVSSGALSGPAEAGALVGFVGAGLVLGRTLFRQFSRRSGDHFEALFDDVDRLSSAPEGNAGSDD